MWTELETRADINFFLSWYWIGAWVEEAGLPDSVLVGRTGAKLSVSASSIGASGHATASSEAKRCS
jgi:hypothetical protein